MESTSHFRFPPAHSSSGLSLIEVLISITIIGIISSIAVFNYGDIFGRSERVISLNFVEQMNNALKEFEQTAWQLSVTADDNGVDDENQILTLLQTKDVTVFGSPHFRGDWSSTESTDEATYRIRWNGVTFELIEPGNAGGGLLFDPEGKQFGS